MNPFSHFAALALTAVAVLGLAACAPHGVSPTVNPDAAPAANLPKTLPGPVPKSVLVDDPPLTLYPILDGTPLLEMPAPMAPRLELMAAHSKVIRFRSQDGWARVLDPASGRIGWMENRLLTPRAPARTDIPGRGTISETF